jgi:hypothetical protein
MSRATGWDSNPNDYIVSSGGMAGPWSTGEQIAPTSPNTFDSQSNYVISIGNGNFIYCGDRWNRNALSDSKYVWLPMKFNETTGAPFITWEESWTVETGVTRPTTTTLIEATSNSVTLIGNKRI